MPNYNVVVFATYPIKEPITVFAKTEDEAKEKAASIVSKWNNVVEARGAKATEIEANE